MSLSPVMWGGRDKSSVQGPGTNESFLCLFLFRDSRPSYLEQFLAIIVLQLHVWFLL